MNKATSNVTKKMMINMKAGSVAMKDAIGLPPFKAIAAATNDGIDDDGEERQFNYIVSEDGTVYSGNSAVVGKVMSDIIDLIDSGEDVNVSFQTITTKGKREAVVIQLS